MSSNEITEGSGVVPLERCYMPLDSDMQVYYAELHHLREGKSHEIVL